MKLAIKGLVVLAFGLWSVWFLGKVFEFEYPYTFTLMRVQTAKSINGVPVAEIIKSDGAKWPPRLHWHTCSYCADNCGKVKGLIYVSLPTPGNRSFYDFAYSLETHTLVPLTHRTAVHYPGLMPVNDPVLGLQLLNGGTGAYGNGNGEFELPQKWFRKATHTEPRNPIFVKPADYK